MDKSIKLLKQGLYYATQEIYDRAIELLKEYVLSCRNNFYAHSELIWCFKEDSTDMNDATTFYEKNFRYTEKDIIYNYYKAEKCYYEDKYDKAINIYTSLLRKGAKSSCVFYSLGLAYEGKNEIKKAMKRFKKSIEADNSFLPSYLALGKRYYVTGNYDIYLDLFKKAFAAGIEEKAALFRDGFDDINILKDMRNFIETYKKGISLAHDKNYKEALRYFLGAQEIASNNLLNIWAIVYCYYMLDELKLAEQHLRGLIAEDSVTGSEVNGILCYHRDDNKQAKEKLAAVLNKSAQPYLVLYFLGRAEYELRETTSAIKRFQDSIKENPKFLPSYYHLSLAYININQYDDAKMVIKHVPKETITYAERYLSGGKSYIRDIEFLYGKICRKSSNYAEAKSTFIYLEKKYPTHGNIRAELGFLDWRDNNIKESRENILKAFELDNELPSKLNDVFIPYLKDLIKSFPNDGALQYWLGLSLAYKDEHDEAIKILYKSSQLPPYIAESYYHLGNLFELRGDTTKSLALYQDALRIKQDFREPAREISLILSEKKDIDTLFEIRDRFPENEALKEGLIVLLLKQENIQKAKEESDLLIKTNPDNIIARVARADWYLKQENIKAAIYEYEHLISKGKGSENIYYTLGELYLRINNFDKAVEYYDKTFATNLDLFFTLVPWAIAALSKKKPHPKSYIRSLHKK